MTETALSVPTPRAASTGPMKVASKVRCATGSSLAVNMSLSKSHHPSCSLVVVLLVSSRKYEASRCEKLRCFFAAAVHSAQLPAKPRCQQRDGMTETVLPVPTTRAMPTEAMQAAPKARFRSATYVLGTACCTRHIRVSRTYQVFRV